VRTGIHHFSFGFYAAQHADKRQQIRQGGTNHDMPRFSDAALIAEEDSLFYEEVEEDDDDHSSLGRKAYWRAWGNPPPGQSTGLNYLNNYSRDVLPFCSHLAHIYITQRALRI